MSPHFGIIVASYSIDRLCLRIVVQSWLLKINTTVDGERVFNVNYQGEIKVILYNLSKHVLCC